MSDPAQLPMTADEFLAWHEGQERRYELVYGVPVAMAGATRRHNRIVMNATLSIGGQLGSGPCSPFASDTAVRIPAGNIRYPDFGIDCGRFVDQSMTADAPTLVIEVLSESNKAFDFMDKLEEYKTVPALRHIVLVDTDAPTVIWWNRPNDGSWSFQRLEGIESELQVTDLGVMLPFRVLYAGIEFHPKPRLVLQES